MQIIRDKLAHNITGDKQLGSFWGYADSSRRLPLAGYNPALRNSTWAEAFLPAAVYPASDKIIIKHNLETGTPLTLSSTGTLPAPLEAGTNYYVIKISDVCIKLAASSADATAGTAIDLTDTGSGIHTLQLEIPAGFGTGTQSDPYRIRTAADLLAMQPTGYGETYDGCDADTYWELLADIDMDDPMFVGEDDTGWAPIGRIAYWWKWTPDYEYHWFIKPFKGHFDGNGHAIKNMRIYRDNNWWDGYDSSTADDPLLFSKYLGFFGAVGGNAVIQNLVIEDPDVYVKFGESGGIGESEREAEGYPMYTAGCFAG
ncbi:MAG: hypothetical protein PHQ00_06230, partial [Phycisphaerae bacterium]|nr:hypothetical protein [Phycisphaerae bacterium]